MGFVLSGMNGGALVAPFVAGAIYDNAGYHAVWGVCLGVVAFDFMLRLTMIEKDRARSWLEPLATDFTRTSSAPAIIANPETEPLLSHDQDSGTDLQQPRNSWFAKKFPAMATLLRSPRILAAVYGCFTHTLLISSFDAVLALFVKRTFRWSSTGAGLIFLAITIPSILGAFIGALSDRYGTRAVALFGFALTVPSLALLGVVTNGIVADQAALVILLVANGNLTIVPNLSFMR